MMDINEDLICLSEHYKYRKLGFFDKNMNLVKEILSTDEKRLHQISGHYGFLKEGFLAIYNRNNRIVANILGTEYYSDNTSIKVHGEYPSFQRFVDIIQNGKVVKSIHCQLINTGWIDVEFDFTMTVEEQFDLLLFISTVFNFKDGHSYFLERCLPILD